MTVVAEGQILAGKYRVERVLATGGMGVVVAALHTQLDQRVALKFLLPSGEASELARGRFLREARAAVRLRSEHVARVLDVGTAETGSPYIVMEYLEGRDLSDLLAERGRLSVEEAVSFVLQAAEAVAEAHALGIVHRDLKPANLFLTSRPDGSPCVKVLDFGISKTQGDIASLTQTRALVGTPHYLSPEQVRSSRSADARSDIWAMGMILYELITGVVAFPRETLPELCSAIILDDIPPILEKVPDLDPALERVICWALSKAPDNRPQTLAELAEALAPFVPGGAAAAARVARILGETPRASTPSLVEIEVPDSRRDAAAAPVQFAATLRVEATPSTPESAPAPKTEPSASELSVPVERGHARAIGAFVLLAFVGVAGIASSLGARAGQAAPSATPASTVSPPSTSGSETRPSASSAPSPASFSSSTSPSPDAPLLVVPSSPVPTISGAAPRLPPIRTARPTASATGHFDDLGPRK